jgi:uroporphyrinogen decarboxylase
MTTLLDTLHGKPGIVPPLWLMRQAGRYLPEYQEIRKKLPNFMDLCFDEDNATAVTLQPLRRFDFDAAILFSDILVIPHVLGQKVRFLESQGPVLDTVEWGSFFNQAKDVDILQALSTPLKIIRNCRSFLPSTKAVIGFSGSPWTIATYMIEQGKSQSFTKIRQRLETRDPVFTQIMTLLEEAIGTLLSAQIQAGADVVQIFDSWAKAVPINHQKEWITEPTRRLITRIRALHPLTPIIYYGRGASHLYPDIAAGMTHIAFSIDEEVPIAHMKDQIQPLAPIQGNLSPKVLVEGGVALQRGVKNLLEAFQGTPYVFNLGHGILPQTPVAHVAQLVNLVKNNHEA